MSSKELNPYDRFAANAADRERIVHRLSITEQDASHMIDIRLIPIRNIMVDEPKNNPEESIAALRDGKQMLEEISGKNLSRPTIAASALKNVGFQLEQAASENLQQGYLLPFIFYHDINHGISAIASSIHVAEDVTRIGLEEVIATEDFDPLSRFGIRASLTQQAQSQVRMNQTYADIAALIKEDPTGGLLVEESAKRLKGLESRIRNSFGIPSFSQFFVEGVNLAVQSYKIHYELAGEI